MTLKKAIHESKTDKLDFKIKNVSSAKDPAKRIRIQATDQEKMFVKYVELSDKGLVSKIQK